MLRMKIYNNTIVSVDQYGIQIGDRGNGGQRFDGLDIRNNIVIDCGTYTQTGNISVLIDTSGGIPNLIIDYNLVGEYNLPRANYRYQGQDLTQAGMQALGYELHGIENPPVASIFNSYSYQAPNNHLTLKPGSPAIGMGLNLGSAYAYDITGEARPAGGFWDAGCYKYTPPACTFTLNPTSVSVNMFAHSGSFTITASSSTCAWTSVSNASWITITSGRSGTGSGTIHYSVSQNFSRLTRTGTITAGGQTFTVRPIGHFYSPGHRWQCTRCPRAVEA